MLISMIFNAVKRYILAEKLMKTFRFLAKELLLNCLIN